jgi:hypothetical protein
MSRPLLALPFTAAELNGKTLVFSVAGVNSGSDMTATLTGLSGNYYNFTESAEDVAVALAAALLAAETAADPGNALPWAVNYDLNTLPGQVKLIRVGSTAVATLKWAAGGTTLNPVWLGFTEASATGAVYASSNYAIDGVHQAGRLWIPRRRTMHGGKPRRQVIRSESLFGVVVERVVGGVKHDWTLRFAQNPYAALYTFAANDSNYTAAVPGLTAGDPNHALQSFWTDMPGRKPIRYTPDKSSLSAYYELQARVEGAEWIDELAAAAENETTGQNYADIVIALSGYVSGS